MGSFPVDERSGGPAPRDQDWLLQTHTPDAVLRAILLRHIDPLAAVFLSVPHTIPAAGEEASRQRAMLTHVLATPLGRIGIFALAVPHLTHGTSTARVQQEVLRHTNDAIALAHACGAQVVALSPWLAEKTNHGVLVQQSLPTRAIGRPRLTTGDATRLAVLLLHLEQLLLVVRREMHRECLALVGSTDALVSMRHALLATLKHPQTLIMHDASPDDAASMLTAQRTHYGSEGTVVWTSHLEEAMTQATVLLDLTAEGILLDSEAMRPGTIMLSHSPVRWRNEAHLFQRLATQEDVLLLEGGHMTSQAPLTALWSHTTSSTQEAADFFVRQASPWHARVTPLLSVNAQVLAGAIVQHGAPAVLGALDAQMVCSHALALKKEGMQVPPLHAGSHIWTDAFLHSFRARFSS